MAKKILDPQIDEQLDVLEGTHIAICSAEPIDYADIANVDLVNEIITGTFTKAAGDVSGRKNTCPAQTGLSIVTSGTANHVVTHNNLDTMFIVTTCTPQVLTAGGTVDTSTWDHEVNAPT